MNHSNQLIISPQEIEKKINRRIMRRFQRNWINRRMKGGQWLLAKKMKNLLKKFNKMPCVYNILKIAKVYKNTLFIKIIKQNFNNSTPTFSILILIMCWLIYEDNFLNNCFKLFFVRTYNLFNIFFNFYYLRNIHFYIIFFFSLNILFFFNLIVFIRYNQIPKLLTILGYIM